MTLIRSSKHLFQQFSLFLLDLITLKMSNENFDIKKATREIFANFANKETLTVKILKSEIQSKYGKLLTKDESRMAKDEIIQLFVDYQNKINNEEDKDKDLVKEDKAIVSVAKEEAKKRPRTKSSSDEESKTTPSKAKVDSKKAKLNEEPNTESKVKPLADIDSKAIEKLNKIGKLF